jgi:L-fucose isomerase-like protein
MKSEVSIGLVCLVRKTFDYKAAAQIYTNIIKDIKKIENVIWEVIPELIFEISEAQKAARHLASRGIDAIICISGTFALGHLILELNKVINKPILLWALEELPYDGGKIRLNSTCGVNLNASNLYKSGVTNYSVNLSTKIDQDWIDAIRIIKKLFASHIALIGHRANGFFNLDVDELKLYKELGILIDDYELQEVFDFEINDSEVEKRLLHLNQTFDLGGITTEQAHRVAELIVKFDNFISTHNIDALAIRCWPEFADEFGISPCAAMSVLQSEHKILTCEGDILGAISMLAHQAIGAYYPFMADFSQADLKENFALLWHCGVASCNLTDGVCIRSLDSYFAGGKGVTADFVMKGGAISILRFDYALGSYRIFLQKAMGLPMEKLLKGTYVKVKFEKGVKYVLQKIIDNGIAHHISVVYGDFIKPFEIFANIKGWEIIQ